MAMSADPTPAAAIRTVEIRPPSLRDETTIVVRLAVVIFAIVGFYLGNTTWSADGKPARSSGLLPYQTLVTDASPIDQRMFRELQEGLLEAERVRTTTGGWPSPETLAEQGIPPFAKDPTAKGATYHWVMTHRGTFINYRGIPGVTGAPAWLLHIQEPLPDSLPDPSPEDEEHHRLPHGLLLHVSVWTHADGAELSPTLVQVPQAAGWIQWRVNPPAVGYTPPPTVKTP